MLNGVFNQLYSRFAFLHELTGQLAFGRAWSARRHLLIADMLPGQVIVDIGCGEGRLLVNPGWGTARRIGVDPSAQATRRARRRGATVVRATAQHVPLGCGSVGRVVCSYPGTWILDSTVWDEFARVLPPGGAVVVLIGGLTTRGRGARARQRLQRLVYGKPIDDAPWPLPDAFGHRAIPGALTHVQDAWGVAYVWRGQRAALEDA